MKFLAKIMMFMTGALALSSQAMDKIAVAEPRITGVQISADQVAGISDLLEAKIENYQVVSRAGLDAVLKETVFQNQSELVSERQRLAKLAQVSGVKYLLTYTLSRPADRWFLTMMVVNAETAEINPQQRGVVEAPDLATLMQRMDTKLVEMGLMTRRGANGLPKVALAGFRNPAGASPSLIGQLIAKIGTKLQNSGVCEVMEREQLQTLVDEAALMELAAAAPGQQLNMNAFEVADYVLTGDVLRLEVDDRMINTAAGAEKKAIYYLQVRLKLLDVVRGRIVVTKEIQTRFKHNEIPATERIDWLKADYDNAFLEKGAVAVYGALSDEINPLMVLMVDGDEVYLNRGTASGLTTGTQFTVYSKGKEIVHPVTKRVIGAVEKMIAEVEVSEVRDLLTVAKRVSGEGMKAGDRCRLSKMNGVTPAESGPAYPAADQGW